MISSQTIVILYQYNCISNNVFILSMSRIVLIDDDPISNFITEKLISNSVKGSCQFFKFDNAKTALDELQDIQPNYLFLDLHMPEVGGWDFLENFNPSNENLKIYILTSSIDERDILKAKQYAFVKEFLSKPLIKNHIQEIFC